MRTPFTLPTIGLLAAALAGCATDWEDERRTVSDAYRSTLLAETQDVLARFPDGLDLDACIATAKARNGKLLGAQLAARIAGLDQTAAWSAFLPQLQVSWHNVGLSKPPAKRSGEQSIVMQDQEVTESSVQIVQPLFAPSAWLLYRTAKRGAEMAELANQRAAQMIELAVVGLYFDVRTAEEAVASQDSELTAARRLLKESEPLAEAGYLADAELARIRAAVAAAAHRAESARRSLAETRGRLLQAMNLWPLAELKLKPPSPTDASPARLRVETPGQEARDFDVAAFLQIPLEERMWHALLSRPEMQIQDRNVSLRRNETLRALLFFIPNLAGFANVYQTSDSYTVNQEYWATGLQATLSSFIGFRDIAAYLKARRQEEAAYVEREDAAMMILLQVIEASHRLEDAAERLTVAEAAAEAAEKALAAAEARHREDLAPLSDLLQARADASRARAGRRTAALAQTVALRALLNVLGGGITALHKENP